MTGDGGYERHFVIKHAPEPTSVDAHLASVESETVERICRTFDVSSNISHESRR